MARPHNPTAVLSTRGNSLLVVPLTCLIRFVAADLTDGMRTDDVVALHRVARIHKNRKKGPNDQQPCTGRLHHRGPKDRD